MANELHFTPEISVNEVVLPFLEAQLVSSGWALVKTEPSDETEKDLLVLSTLVGQKLGRCMGFHSFEQHSCEDTLIIHTEGVSKKTGIFPYFALGCIHPSATGGNTRLFDGREAARRIDSIPGLAEVTIEYFAFSKPSERARYPLVIPDLGRTVRYRSKVESNIVIQHNGFAEEEIYTEVDDIVKGCQILCHPWRAGDLLFVNNLITLHDRLPFNGYRRMLRVRYDDEQYARVRY